MQTRCSTTSSLAQHVNRTSPGCIAELKRNGWAAQDVRQVLKHTCCAVEGGGCGSYGAFTHESGRMHLVCNTQAVFEDLVHHSNFKADVLGDPDSEEDDTGEEDEGGKCLQRDRKEQTADQPGKGSSFGMGFSVKVLRFGRCHSGT